MAKFLKGQDVKLQVNIGTEQWANLLEQETSCSLSFNVNTLDAANKSDSDPEYDHSDYDNTELSAQVSGNAKDVTEIKSLLKAAIDDGKTYKIKAVLGSSLLGTDIYTEITLGTQYNEAVITSLDIDMPADGLATVSASIECGSDFSIS